MTRGKLKVQGLKPEESFSRTWAASSKTEDNSRNRNVVSTVTSLSLYFFLKMDKISRPMTISPRNIAARELADISFRIRIWVESRKSWKLPREYTTARENENTVRKISMR